MFSFSLIDIFYRIGSLALDCCSSPHWRDLTPSHPRRTRRLARVFRASLVQAPPPPPPPPRLSTSIRSRVKDRVRVRSSVYSKMKPLILNAFAMQSPSHLNQGPAYKSIHPTGSH